MRDPLRIGPLLELVEKVWQQNPDLRLGQLIVGVVGYNDPFYISDDELDYLLHGWLKEVK